MAQLGTDKNGRIYELASANEKGRQGKRKAIEYVNESSVSLGENSKNSVKVRKLKEAQEKSKKHALLQKKKAIAKKVKEVAIKKQKIKIASQKKTKKINVAKAKANSARFFEATAQSNMGYEYSSIHGSPFQGFEQEGKEITNQDFTNNFDIECSDSFGANTIYNGQGLDGFSFKAPKIKVNVKKAIKSVGKVATKVYMAPITVGIKVVKATPVLKDVHKGVDKLTGGTLSKLDRIANLPQKIADGKPISKAEIMEAVMTAVQVAAIVASGGSAAALVAAGAGMLKGGPLGDTAFGRNILTIAEIAGGAAAIQSTASAQLAAQGATQGASQGANIAATTAAKEVAKMSATDAAKKAVQNHVANMVKSKAEEEFEKKTGIPVTIATKVYNLSTGSAKLATLPKDILKTVGEEQLKKAGLGSSVTQAIMSNNASQLGVMIKNAPDVLMEKGKRELIAQQVKLKETLNIENLKKKIEAKVERSVTSAKALEALQEQFEKAATKELQAQIQKLMASKAKEAAKYQEESLVDANELQLEQARASLRVAAAEEGRYDGQSFQHPMLRYFRG